MSWVRSSLRAKLIASIGAAVVVALGVLILLSSVSASSTGRKDAYAEMSDLAAAKANQFDLTLKHARAVVKTLGQITLAYRGQDRAALNAMVRQIEQANSEFDGTYLQLEPGAGPGPDSAFKHRSDLGSGAHGYYVPYWRWDHGKVVSSIEEQYSAKWYLQARENSGRFLVEEPYSSGANFLVSLLQPIVRNGKFAGVSGADLKLYQLDREARAIKVLKTGYAFVVTGKGTFVSAPDRKLVGRTTLAKFAARQHSPAFAKLATAIAHGQSVRLKARDPFTGKASFMVTAPIRTAGWSLVLVAPSSEALASATALRNYLIVVGLLALLVVIAAVLVVASRLTRPLRRLEQAAEAIAAGDVSVEVEVTSRDEIGRLAGSFQHVAGYMRETARAARAIAEHDLTVAIESASERDELRSSFVQMRDNLREILARYAKVAETLRDSSTQLSLSSQESGAAVGEIAELIANVAQAAEQQIVATGEARKSTADVLEAAGKVDGLAREGVQAALHAEGAVTAVRESSTRITEVVRSLAERSQAIGGMAEAITAIAEETNLLALNAAIEAARAGENGRSFAVVAGEVRRLADNCQQTAGSIGEVIVEVQSEMQRTVAAIDAGTARNEEVARVVEELRDAFAMIRAAVEGVTEQASAVERATSSVDSLSARSSAAMESASAAAEQTSASSQQVAASATELADVARDLDELALQFTL